MKKIIKSLYKPVILCTLLLFTILFYSFTTISLNSQDEANTKSVEIQKVPKPLKIKLCNHLYLFTPIFGSVFDGLRELGFSVEVVGTAGSERYDLNDKESIFITALTHEGGNFPKNFIAYNWEQLTAHEIRGSLANYIDLFRNAIEVWDYSEENVKMFKRHGINARVVLPGYHHTWNLFGLAGSRWDQGFSQKTIDSAFFGQYREQRIPWIDRLKAELPSTFKVLGTPDAYSAKAVVNLHIFPNGTILEIHRIMQVVSQKVLVLSETSDDPFLDALYGPMITFFSSYEDLLEKIAQVGNMTEIEYEKEVLRRYKYFENMPRFAENFKQVDSFLWL